jgi:hypothetical protein
MSRDRIHNLLRFNHHSRLKTIVIYAGRLLVAMSLSTLAWLALPRDPVTSGTAAKPAVQRPAGGDTGGGKSGAFPR